MRKLVSFLMFFCFLTLTASGCSATFAMVEKASIRDSYIVDQIDNYEYTEEFSDVWAKAAIVMLQNGFFIHMTHDNMVIESDWTTNGDRPARQYFVTATVSDDGKSKIRFEYYTQSVTGDVSATSARDYRLEFELLKMVNWNRWEAINMEADRYAKDRSK